MTDEDFEQEDLDLQRRLDAAFSQTRPRRGFEDLLWAIFLSPEFQYIS